MSFPWAASVIVTQNNAGAGGGGPDFGCAVIAIFVATVLAAFTAIILLA